MNKAATGSASYPLDGSTPAYSAKPVTGTIMYDAPSKTYTLIVDGRSQSFAPGDIDSSLGSAGAVVYVKKSGNTTDSLTLTKPGTSGRFTYRYVGSAFWQRTIEGSATISGTFDAFVYGVKTPNVSVPRTGQAQFSVDLLGTYTQPDGIAAATGEGSMQVDFATGGLATYIGLNTGGTFQGTGQLSSSSNEVAGKFTSSGPGFVSYNGTFNGMFFGPSAEEFGAAFSSNPFAPSVFVGTIMGRRDTTGSNGDFDTMLVPEFFTTDRRRVVFDKNGSSAPATLVSSNTGNLAIGFDPAASSYSARYNFFLPDGIVSDLAMPDQGGLDTSSILTYAGLSNSLQTLTQGWLQYAGNQKYMRAVRLVQHAGSRYTFDDFVFGMPTLRDHFPTGTAGYDVNLWGTLFGKTEAPMALQGQGALTADFATGQITASGAVANYADMFDVVGTYHASAALASGSAAFNGSFDVDDGAITYNGDWDGSFFGPNGEEVGSTFLADGTDGSVMSGVIVGSRDDSIIAADAPLSELTESTVLHGSMGYYSETGGSPKNVTGQLDLIDISYNPATGGYHIVPSEWAGNPGNGPIDAEFDNGDKDVAQSNSSYTVYHTADGLTDAEVLNFGAGTNPVIELSYSSMAHVFQRRDHNGDTLTNEYWVAFGEQTPDKRTPHSGTASYSGIVRGGGYVDGIGKNAQVTGTMTAQVNFGTIQMSSTFNLNAEDPSGLLPDIYLGSYSAAGEVSGGLAAGESFSGGSWGMSGDFFGPNAEEIGGFWSLKKDGAPGAPIPNGVDVTGAFLGKKD